MTKFHSKLAIGLATALGSASILPAFATANGTASLTWNASTSGGIIGYNLYFGTASRVYTSEVPLGNVTTATVNNLLVGTTYYFAVTAVDSMGLESGYSNEQVFTVTAGLPFLRIGMVNGRITLTGSASVGVNYNVMASADLKSWNAIGSVTGSTNGSIRFTDPTSPHQAARYYRLKSN
jgi:hypothetical protein